ncbi:MAG: WD40 repeat domain-containing protein, partial [Gemmataceae bacterium]
GDVCVIDARTGRCGYRLDHKESVHNLRLSADGDVLVRHRFTATGIEVEVHRRTAKKTLVLRDFPKDGRLRWCLDYGDFSHLSPDGRWLVLSTEDGRLHRWDLISGKEASPLTETLRSTSKLAWSPEGRYVAAQGSALPPNVLNNVIGEKHLRDVRVWDVRTGIRLPHLTVPNRHGGIHIHFSHDERTMLTTDMQGVIHLWEVATGKERGRLHGHLPYEIGSLALSADGRMLVSGGYDTQGFVWDVTGRMPDGQWRTTTLSSEQRRAAWETLASTDAKAAYRASWQLVADPDGTVTFLKEQVRPIARPEPAQVARWITGLDSPEFAERERAERALEAHGETVAAEMRRTLTQKPSLEVRRRIEALLEKLQGVPQGRQLQALRVLEVLEHLNTSEARTLLRKLADGASGARLTAEARLALRRCQTRRSP